MKRVLLVVLSVLLVATMVAAAGCGATDEAKEYMKEGDDLSVELKEYTETASKNLTDFLVELGVDLALTGTTEFKTVVDQASTQINNLIAEGEKAKASYEKILSLDGVEDYKQYADYRIKAIDYSSEVLKQLENLLTTLETAASQGKSLKDTVVEWGKQNASVIADAVKATTYWVDAENLKKNKNL